MSANILELIDEFGGLRVLIVGEAMLDSYLQGYSDRLCREAPVPVVNVQQRRNWPGGAGNTAVNVRSLGGSVHLLSVVGDDLEGEILRSSLEENQVSASDLIVDPGRRTLAKHRVLADSQMLVRFDQGDTQPIERYIEGRLIQRLRELYPQCDAVIISDYGYGVLTPRVVQAIAELQAENPKVLVADAKDVLSYREVGVTAVKPNYHEAVKILEGPSLSGPFARSDQIAYYGEAILAATGAQIAAVTLDTEGALILERGRAPYRTYAQPSLHSRATGAGDTFVSALTLALGAGAHTAAAAELASAAAAIVVQKDGTAACFADELRSYVSAEEKLLGDWDRLANRMAMYRRQGKRVVFTNGVFDILHSGHISYLNQAKELGDVLVVGLNSDDSVRRLKGPARPINSLADRAQVLAGLSSIDLIVPFDQDTPLELIEVVRPDIFVKGGDYSRENLPEVPMVEHLGGIVEILPFIEERSTSGIIQRICQAQACRALRD